MMSHMGSMNNQIADAEEGYTEQMRAHRKLWLSVAAFAICESKNLIRVREKEARGMCVYEEQLINARKMSRKERAKKIASRRAKARRATEGAVSRAMSYYTGEDWKRVMEYADVYFSEEQIRKCLTPKSLGGSL